MKRTILLMILVAVLVPVRSAEAFSNMTVTYPKHDVSFGASTGYLFSGDHSGFATTLDFTYMPEFLYWASVGARAVVEEGQTAWYPYAEAGIWLIAAFGIGYDYGAMGTGIEEHSLHLFVGVPVPVFILDDFGTIYFEPYYRPVIGLYRFEFAHEIGVLLKVCTFEI